MAVGEVDVDGMLARIPGRLFAEWMAYYALEPFGQERENLHAGLVAAAVYNVNMDPKKRRKLIKPSDLLFKFDSSGAAKVKKTSSEIYALFRAWAVVHGAKNGE